MASYNEQFYRIVNWTTGEAEIPGNASEDQSWASYDKSHVCMVEIDTGSRKMDVEIDCISNISVKSISLQPT